MGISGMLMKKKEDFNFNKLIYDIRDASKKAGIICVDTDSEKFRKDQKPGYECWTFNLRDIEDDTDNLYLIYVYNDIYRMTDGGYSFIDEKSNYQQCIHIENFHSCKMLFDFIYEYMKLNKEDVFWDEYKWHYTFEDIEKISKIEPFDEEWAYKNLHELLEN